jgi:hypothetical protein
LIPHQKFPWVHVLIETLAETRGRPDNEPKVPEEVGHEGKEKVYPRTCHEQPDDEQTYSFGIYLTL